MKFRLVESNNGENWQEYARSRLGYGGSPQFIDDLWEEFKDAAIKLVERAGYNTVELDTTLTSEWFRAWKDGVPYTGQCDLSYEKDIFRNCCLEASTREEALDLCARKYAELILKNLRPDSSWDRGLPESRSKYARRASLRESQNKNSVSDELYNVYNNALDTMLTGANADLPENIKEAFSALGGSAFFKSVKPHFISGTGYLPHKGNDRGYSINFMISDERDVRRLAQDITMAYYRTKLNGQLYTTSQLMKLVLNHDTVELTEDILGSITGMTPGSSLREASTSFQPGDLVYVTVANRQGRVKRMINSDLVEVEMEDNGVYPARIDRYYTSDVELLGGDEDLYEDAEMETYTTSFCFGDYCKSFKECQDYFGYHADEYRLTITCTQTDDEHCTIEIVGTPEAIRQYKNDFELDEQDAVHANNLHEDAAPSTITWEDLRDYKYSFTMQARNSPNATWGDDCRRVAAQCGCIRLYYHNKFGREVNKFLCKSEAEHKELISRLEGDKMLRGYAAVSNLYPFNISDVEVELQKKFQTEVDNYKEVNPPRGRNKKVFSARTVQLLLKRLPGVYVYCGPDMADSVDLRVSYDPQIFAE